MTAFPAAWPLWLEHAGVAKLKPARTISVDSFVAAMQAAEQGAGVALGLEPFITERERQQIPQAFAAVHQRLIQPLFNERG